MHDLRWTMPVSRWSATAAAATADISFIEPIVRRRLSSLSRSALKVAHDCVAELDRVRVVFASRHGELRRTTEILRAISTGEPVSPTAFSLSVLNAMTGIFGIARGDRSPASAVSAGAETLGLALLEAHAQFAVDPDWPVLVVYADEPADPVYGTIEDEVQGGALAILIDARDTAGHLSCTLARSAAPASAPVPGQRYFRTQSEAVVHCLDTHAPAAWRFARQERERVLGDSTWQWSWHEAA
ncbi:beta-ketoacyl synthase chain length factor [Caballeronia sp.]|uniref:beta-ketoacyl synthase chain length factor n=1 Tax=Caballeronia sp. TaxID=1931223 RepID=UPI003C68D798